MIYFTADFHLSHKTVIRYCNRPFSCIEAMNETILHNFFSTVSPKDIVYFLGDLSFKKQDVKDFFDKIERYKIRFHFIKGNHDDQRILHNLDIPYYDMLDIKVNKIPITLCHYAMLVWNKSHYGAWQLFGHSHGALQLNTLQYDVGVDNNNLFPINFEQIKEIMDKKGEKRSG